MNTTAIAANLAALLAAIGVNVYDPLWRLIIEVAAGVIALGGIVFELTRRRGS